MKRKYIKVLGNRGFTTPADINQHIIALFNQKPITWKKKFNKIAAEIADGEIDGIIIFLATPLLLQVTSDEYSKLFLDFLKTIEKIDSLILIYQGNLNGNFDHFNFESKEYWDLENIEKEIKRKEEELSKENKIDNIPFGGDKDILDRKIYKLEKAKERIADYQQRKENVESVINKILSSNVEVSAFKDIDEANIKVESFYVKLSKNIFFSFYVPRRQFYSEEFDQFVRVFEKYVQKIEKKKFVIETQASEEGVYYYFKSNNKDIKIEDIDISVSSFNQFMEMSNNSPDELFDILSENFKDKNELLNIINDLNKKYKRLFIDLKHQKEYLTLKYHQELESNIAEHEINHYPTFLIEKNFDSFLFQGNSKQLINANKYSEEEEKIISLVKTLSDSQILSQTQSDIEVIKDNNLPTNERKTSMLKIKETLYRVARKTSKKVEDLGIKILVEYIDKQINNR